MYDLGIAFTSEGFDDLSGKLDAIHGRVGKVVDVLNMDDEAKAKNALQTKALSDQIDRNIISYTGATSAVLEYQAKLIGQSDALAAQIALLKQAEQAQKALGDAERLGKDWDRANIENKKRDAQSAQDALDKRLADEKRAAAEAARIQKDARDYASSLRKQEEAEAQAAYKQREKLDVDLLKQRQADYAALMKAAQDDVTAATDAAKKKAQEEIAWAKKSADERIAILKDFQAMQAHPDLGTGAATAKFGSAAAANVGSLSGMVSEKELAAATKNAEKLALEEIAWADKSWTARNAIMQQAQQAMASSAISQATVVEKFGATAVKSLADHTGHMAEYEKHLKNTGNTAHGTGSTLKEMWANVNLLTGRARQELVVLAHELAQGRYTRFAQSLMVLAEYGGFANIVTSAVGLSVIALGAAFVGTIYQIAKGSLEIDKINAAMSTTGGITALNVTGFYNLARSASASAGTIGDAKEIMLGLASTGRFTGEQLASIGPAIVAMAQVSGLSIKELSGHFESLAKDPTKAVEKLNEQFHFLTVETYQQISAMEEQGNKMGAAALAMKTYADEGLKRSKELIENLGFLASAWHKVERAASEAKDAVMKWGQKDTTVDKLLEANERVIEQEKKMAQAFLFGGGGQAGYDAAKALYIKYYQERYQLTYQFEKEQLALQGTSQKAQFEQEAIEAEKRLKARENVNRTPLEKRQIDDARAYNDTGTFIQGLLSKAGVANDSILEAGKFAVASSADTTQKMMSDAARRYGTLVGLAQKYGVDIVQIQERLEDQLRRVAEKRKGTATPNSSFNDTNKAYQDALRDFENEKRIGAARVSEAEKQFAVDKRIAADRLSSARDVSRAVNDINIADLSAYMAHIANVGAAGDKYVKDIKATSDATLQAAVVRYMAETNALKTQKQVTPKDRTDYLAKEAEAQDHLRDSVTAYVAALNKANSAAENSVAVAQADDFKASSKEISGQIDLLDRKYVVQLREYNLMGASDEARRRSMLTEKARGQQQVASQILATELAIEEKADNEELVKLLNERLKQLQMLEAQLRRMSKLEADVFAKQTSAMEGWRAAVTKYQDGIADQFKSTEAAASKAFKGMEDSLVSFLTTGKGHASDFFRSLAADMIRLAVQQRIMGPLMKMIFGGGGGGFGVDAFAGDALFGDFGGKAMGGAVGANSLQRVNEMGPELLSVGNKQYLMMGNQGGTVTPSGGYGSSAGGGQQITVVVHQTVGDVATVSMLRASNDQLVKQIRGGIARSQKYAGSMS